MCNAQFTVQQIQRHAESCLRRSNGNNGDESSADDESAEEYEEYEWAGQKRIRVSSMIQGGYAALGIGQPLNGTANGSNGADNDEDEDLNVDEDDTQIYGPAQYSESDVIAITTGTEQINEENNVTNYMRRLITGTTDNSTSQSNASNIPSRTEIEDSNTFSEPSANSIAPSEGSIDAAAAQEVIKSLKAKLRHYENQVQNKFKCLICLDDYKNPAISVACWHVHCEQCWLRSLGARKLCPQCNLITTPKDLRRIYM